MDINYESNPCEELSAKEMDVIKYIGGFLLKKNSQRSIFQYAFVLLYKMEK